MPKNKVVPIDEAMSHIKSGMSIAVGGFIGQGDPLTLIDYLKTMDVGDLTIYENDAGYRERGVVELVKQGKIKKVVASHIGTTPEIGKAMNEGRLEVEPTPQGTLAEMMRCGGAGLGGFLTPTGIGTVAEEGKQIVELDGRKYILVPSLKCDVAIIRAHARRHVGQPHLPRHVAQLQRAGRHVRRLRHRRGREPLHHGRARPQRHPHLRHLRGRGRARQRRVLHRSGRRRSMASDAKKVIAARAGQELKDGQIINLGIGLPTLVANYVPEGVDVVIQTENGAIGVGPAPDPGCEDRDRANAGNQPISLIPGGSYFDSRHLVRA